MQVEVKDSKVMTAEEIRPGMYDVRINFRRAIVNPETRKCSFVEEEFCVEMFAQSKRHCFDAVLDYLKNHTMHVAVKKLSFPLKIKMKKVLLDF